MASLPKVKQILKEEIPDSPAWFDRVLRTLNLFMVNVYDALNGNLDFVNNVRANYREFTITAGATATAHAFRFTHSLKRKPIDVRLAYIEQIEDNYTPITANVSLYWRIEADEIVVTSIVGLTNAKKYKLALLAY